MIHPSRGSHRHQGTRTIVTLTIVRRGTHTLGSLTGIRLEAATTAGMATRPRMKNRLDKAVAGGNAAAASIMAAL